MAILDSITVYCPTTATMNQISINFIDRVGSEAYIEVISQYLTASSVDVVVQVHDDCSGLDQYVTVTIPSGNNFAYNYSSGLGACGSVLGSGISITPTSDGTYSYHF